MRDAPISFFQQRIAILATGAATNGAVGAVEVTTPRGSAPPLHIHHREDEAFYVLEGEYRIWVGSDEIAGVPGTWVFGPRDVPHGYEVQSERGRHLSLTLPAGFEAFFEDVADIATPSTDPRSVMQRLAQTASKYGVELLGPPGYDPLRR